METVEAVEVELESGRSSPTQTRVHFVSLLSVALVLRLTLMLSLLRRDPREWFYNQASELGCLAQSILAGRGLSSPFGGETGPSAFLAPGYPALVAGVFRIFGSYSVASAATLLILQTTFAVATVLLIMLVAQRAFGNRTANIAGCIWALSPLLIWLPEMFWESCLSTLFLTGMLALAMWCVERPTRSRWVVIGVCCGVAMLVNPALMIAMGCILGWAAYKTRHISRSAPLLAILTWLVVFSPWPNRNMHTLHAFIPMRSNLGYELWQGNRAGANGYFSVELHPNTNREQFARYASLGEVAYMKEKSTQAMTAIRGNPLRFIGLTAKRVVDFWLGLDGRARLWLLVAHVVFTTAFGFAGIVMLAKRQRHLAILFLGPLLMFPLPYYLTHPDFRFRLVLDPITTILSAYAITRWLQHHESQLDLVD